MMIRKNKQGFTILELLIATTVFSVVLLIVSAGIIYIGKVYYRTVTQNKAQEATRSIVEQVAQSIQFTGGDVVLTASGVCVGNTMYQPFSKTVTADTPGLLRGAHDGFCSSIIDPNPSELIPDGMFLHNFQVTEIGTSDVFTVQVHVVALPKDEPIAAERLFHLGDGVCKGGQGSEYCASSRLETTVKKRL